MHLDYILVTDLMRSQLISGAISKRTNFRIGANFNLYLLIILADESNRHIKMMIENYYPDAKGQKWVIKLNPESLKMY